MSTPESTAPSAEPPIARSGADAGVRAGIRWTRLVGLVVGLVLLAAALVVLWRHRETVSAALGEMRRPSPALLALLAGSIVANLLLSGALYSVLIQRYGRVGLLEMQGLIASSAMLNYLPLRPGLFGRVAYHRACNDIRVRDTAATVLQAVLLSLVVAAWVALALVLCVRTGWPIHVGVLAPAPLLLAACAWRAIRPWAAALLIRLAEVLVWAVRYYAAFRLLGVTVDPEAALAFACISIVATLVPFVSNGLGIREWAIGLAAPLLSDQTMEIGLTAELVNRAVEIVVIVAAGSIATPLLARHRMPTRAGSPDPEP